MAFPLSVGPHPQIDTMYIYFLPHIFSFSIESYLMNRILHLVPVNIFSHIPSVQLCAKHVWSVRDDSRWFLTTMGTGEISSDLYCS